MDHKSSSSANDSSKSQDSAHTSNNQGKNISFLPYLVYIYSTPMLSKLSYYLLDPLLSNFCKRRTLASLQNTSDNFLFFHEEVFKLLRL